MLLIMSKIVTIFVGLLCVEGAGSKVLTKNFENSQLLFREEGSLINKATFVHVKFPVDMTKSLSEIAGFISLLQNAQGSANRPTGYPAYHTLEAPIILNSTIRTDSASAQTLVEGAAFLSTFLAEQEEEGNEHPRPVDHEKENITRDGFVLRPRQLFESEISYEASVTEEYKRFRESRQKTLEMEKRIEELLEIQEKSNSTIKETVKGIVKALKQIHLSRNDVLATCSKLLSQGRDELQETLAISPRESAEDLIHSRTKRFIGEIMAGVALGLATSNSLRIQDLEIELEKFSLQFNGLVDATSLLGERFGSLSLDYEIHKRFFLSLSSQDMSKIITQVMLLNEEVHLMNRRIKSTIMAAQYRRLSPEMISGKELEKLFIVLHDISVQQNARMLIGQPSDIYSLQATYGFDDEKGIFAVYVHVPFVESDQELKLLKFVPFPLGISKELNATVMPKVGDQVYLALIPTPEPAKDANGPMPHYYRTMSESDLLSCEKLGKVHLCGGRNTLRTDIESSCIGSLWLQEHSHIEKNCDLEFSESREFVAKMSARQWMVYSPDPMTKNAYCGSSRKQTSFPVRFGLFTEITLPEDCKLVLWKHVLTTDKNLDYELETTSFDWSYDKTIFDNIVNGDHHLLGAIRSLVNNKKQFAMGDLSHLKYFYERVNYSTDSIWRALADLDLWSWFKSGLVTVGIVGVLILLFVIISSGLLKKCCCFPGLCCCGRERPEPVVNFVEAPPPYAEIVQPSAPLMRPGTPATLRRNNSIISVATAFREPGAISERSGARAQEQGEPGYTSCNPGPPPVPGLSLKDFQCFDCDRNRNIKTGCVGSWIISDETTF